MDQIGKNSQLNIECRAQRNIDASSQQRKSEPFDRTETSSQQRMEDMNFGDLPALDQPLQQQQGGSECIISKQHLNASLLEACKAGRKFIVQKLIRSGAEVNVRGKDRFTTPLLIAAEQGFVDIAAFLLSKDADINVIDRHKNSVLIIAVNRAGSSDMLNLLLAYDANFDHQNSEGVTALMKAVEVMDIDAVRILIIARANLNLENKRGETARDIAVRLGLAAVFDSLKSEPKTSMYDPHIAGNKSALSNAALLNHREAVKILLDCIYIESEVKWKSLYDSKEGNQSAKIGALVVLIESICSDATENKDLSDVKFEIAKVIIESGINAEKAKRVTLSEMLVDATQSGFYELVEVLCKVKNIEINYLKKSQSALMVAAEVGRLDLLELLLSYGADPKRENHRGDIALTYALANSQIDCANVLLERHKPCERILREMTRTLVQRSQLESLTFLASHLNLGKISQDLMEKAILTGDSRVVQLLIDHGADINGPRGGGNFAL